MLRRVSALFSLILLSGCTTIGNDVDELQKRLSMARADAQTNAAADDYGQFLVARYASLTNDPGQAAENYAHVALSQPGDRSIVDRAVFSALLADRFDLARSIASNVSKKADTQSPLASMTLATDALAKARYADVPGLLEDSDPGIFDTLIFTTLRAWALFGEGDTARAQLTLLEASSGDAYLDSLLLNMLAIMEVATGNDAAAVKTFSKLESSGTLIAHGAVSYAQLLSAEGLDQEAKEILENFRANAGPNPLITGLQRRLEQGETLSAHRPDTQEGAALSIYIPAAALASRTQTDLPGVYYALALHLDPDLNAARALWADALDRAGRHTEAIAKLEEIPESSPYYSGARGQLAWAFLRSGDNARALELVQHTLAGQPERDLRIQMGDLLQSLDREEEAVDVFSGIIEDDRASGEQDWRLYYTRGALRERMGLWPSAEQDLKTAKSLNPHAPEVLNYLGYSWIDRGMNLEEGLELVRKALTLRPDSGEITDSLGWAHYRLGNIDQSISYLERAVELKPGLAEINEHLGDAYWAAGRRTEARYQWQRAMSLLEADDEIERLRRKSLTGPVNLPPALQNP
ncbi:tetratricopeptide repeat protein [Henriciella sp.]|uniref:tetratricopeptide repeat protein n=1 Tax=Henriciella sp. TaxID=1968823 RepID=UPI0026217BE1|nr:tetratricopeptide repeat protein [Henriciella sp.]